MNPSTREDARAQALSIFEAGLAAADPRKLLGEGLTEEPGIGWRYGEGPVFPFPEAGGRILILGAGKAAGSLAGALEEKLKSHDYSGRIIVKYGHGEPLTRVVVEEAGHPLPDGAGVTATKRLLDDLVDTRASDRVFFALTGGASALLVAPAAGLTLEDKVATTDRLLRSGATIQEINAVRKHLSTVKGGRLLEHMAPARVLAFVISDVIGDDLSSIGSGPLVGDPTTYSDCLAILRRYELEGRVPVPVGSRLREGALGRAPETPKPGTPVLELQRHIVLASNRSSLRAAGEKAKLLGFEVEVFARDMQGDVHRCAREFAERLAVLARTGRRWALLAGGELTVKVAGTGRGGRNQELALVASRHLSGVDRAWLLSAGTDGTDGPTDAAGAFVDGGSWNRARELGLDPAGALSNNDSYPLFVALGDIVRTGPTGTNVNDLMIGLTGL
ncbi:MAG TPA: glycerate kinase [Vicinamibacteria bacterium]|nr:glycerate kinase [Vicinamibacteria bacterium]